MRILHREVFKPSTGERIEYIFDAELRPGPGREIAVRSDDSLQICREFVIAAQKMQAPLTFLQNGFELKTALDVRHDDAAPRAKHARGIAQPQFRSAHV